MEQKKHQIEYKYYSKIQELSADDQELLKQARFASQAAYAPYSEFKVGAAVQLHDGEIILGSNQENAAYPSGLCAERVAIFSASANFPNEKISCIAIYAHNTERSGDIISPCGSCRQVISEYEHKQNAPIRVLLMNFKAEVWEFGQIEDLLPFSFKLQTLKKNK